MVAPQDALRAILDGKGDGAEELPKSEELLEIPKLFESKIPHLLLGTLYCACAMYVSQAM